MRIVELCPSSLLEEVALFVAQVRGGEEVADSCMRITWGVFLSLYFVYRCELDQCELYQCEVADSCMRIT